MAKDVKSERERETLLELYPAKVVLWKYFLNKVKLYVAACSLARKMCVHCHIALTGNSLTFNSESVYIVSSKFGYRTAREVELCPILRKVVEDFVQ